MFDDKTYRAWWCAKRRCENPKNSAYSNYGGKGIKMHWKTYKSFVSDMGYTPLKKTLDRINNNGHYELKNCRWCSHKENMRNRRNNNRITIRGVTKILVEWAEFAGIKHRCLWMRLYHHKWSPEEAVGFVKHFKK